MSEETFVVRCPHCRAAIERPALPDGETLPGSPLRACPDCGRLYYDEGYQEPALKAYAAAKGNFSYIKILYAVIPTLGTLFYLSAFVQGTNAVGGTIAAVFGAIAVFFDVLLILEIVKAVRHKRLLDALTARLEGRAGTPTEEERASMERLSSKDYLDTLDKCGDDVADWFYTRIGEKPRPKTLRERILGRR